MPIWNGRPLPDHSTSGSVQRRLGDRRVVPREPPQLAALVGPQAAAHEDDALDLVERCSELDSLDEGRPDLVVYGAPVSLPVLRPLWGRFTQSGGGLTQTRNWPFSCNFCPSTVMEPPSRRSQTMSQWTAESLVPPDSG